MRIAVPFLALLIAFGMSTDGVAKERPRPAASTTVSAEIVPGMVFVKFKEVHTVAPGTTATGISSVDRILSRVLTSTITPMHKTLALKKGFTSKEEAGLARIMKVRYTSAVDARKLAAELAADPSVEYAEPMYVFQPLETPNDPRLSTQWTINMLKMTEAWDISKGDSTIVIGYVDSGVNYNHEDLSLAIAINAGEWGTNGELKDNGADDDNNGYVDDWRGWDFIGNGTLQLPNPDNDPMDFNGHGTNGAGVAAASTNNGLGIAGIGYYTKVLPIKVQDDAAQGGFSGYDGIIYAADMGCRVINCSWGANGMISQTLQDVVDYAWSKGVLVVGAAGNSVIDNDLDPFLPSSLNHVLSVGSINEDGSATTTTAYGSSVHVYAPGVNVLTTRGSFGYQAVSGTSFSAPHISGIAALIIALHPDWTPDQVLEQIRVTADPFGAEHEAKRYGRANALNALSMNQSLTDIPGVMVESYSVSTVNGSIFSEGGQTADITVTLKNMLAPTSNATVELILDGAPLTASVTSYTLGALQTLESKSLNLQVRLNEDVMQSEGYIPVILKITDGSYVDFEVVRVPVYLTNSWHTVVDLTYPYNSIDHANRWTIWVSGDYAPNGVITQDIALRSTDGGDTWQFAFGTGFPTGVGVYCIDGIDENSALVGTGPANGAAAIFRTGDGGQNWAMSSVSNMTAFVNWIHMYDSQNGIMQGDPKSNVWGIATTANGGQTWTPIATPLAGPGTEAGWNNSYDVVGDNVWFGTNNSKIYRSTDRGQTWTGYATPSKNSVDVNFRDEMVGVARFSKQGEVGTDTLAVTQDGGLTWSLISTIAAPSGSVIFERGGKRLWFFQGPNAFVSEDLGATWYVQPVPVAFNYINDATEWNDGFVTSIFAAGIEIFRYNGDFLLGVDDVNAVSPQTPMLLPLYPNPVASGSDGNVVAQLQLPSSGSVILAVYDMSGKKVREVLNATLGAGTHNANVSTVGLPAGNYMLRLNTAAYSSTQKLVVLN